jgi:ubiquinone/menaquinone biosynthesis C-methylase UbiE
MGLYHDRVLPRIMDKAMSQPAFGATRQRLLADVTGEVLEIGFGSGTNLDYYSPSVTSVRAVEPSARAVALAEGRIATSRISVTHIGTDAQSIPLPDGCIDTAVTAWTLCTVPRPEQALSELARVLKPGGRLRFVEHGRSPDPKTYRRQQRWEPLWKKAFGGCHLTRTIDDQLAGVGLEITEMETFEQPKDPKIANWTFLGTAVRV